MSKPIPKPTVSPSGEHVFVEIHGTDYMLSAQTAYDLREAIGSVLSECGQPFKPWPREDTHTLPLNLVQSGD